MRKLSRNEWIAVVVAICFIGYMLFGDMVSNVLAMFNTNQSMTETQQGGLQVEAKDIVIGSGTEIKSGMQVSVNYVLRLQDGTVIQDSKLVGGGEPFKFIAGAGQLIPGWEMGILGMKVGGKRMIVIPPELGYGSQQVGPIPANSTLIFEIEVVDAKAVQ